MDDSDEEEDQAEKTSDEKALPTKEHKRPREDQANNTCNEEPPPTNKRNRPTNGRRRLIPVCENEENADETNIASSAEGEGVSNKIDNKTSSTEGVDAPDENMDHKQTGSAEIPSKERQDVSGKAETETSPQPDIAPSSSSDGKAPGEAETNTSPQPDIAPSSSSDGKAPGEAEANTSPQPDTAMSNEEDGEAPGEAETNTSPQPDIAQSSSSDGEAPGNADEQGKATRAAEGLQSTVPWQQNRGSMPPGIPSQAPSDFQSEGSVQLTGGEVHLIRCLLQRATKDQAMEVARLAGDRLLALDCK
jgi:hypothetical protein